jgi:hypothetical protein|tara:strand:- start:953 stop:1426 length:474 start_codon:yes stop_codon:yes gene_type:complete
MAFTTQSAVGIDFDGENETTPSQTLGAKMVGTDGSEWIYCLAGGAVAQYDCVAVTEAMSAVPITKALADTGEIVGVAPVAIASGSYAWVQTSGVCTLNVLASCAADAKLYTSATAGSLDDASSSQTQVHGLKLTSARGGSAGEAAALAMHIRAGGLE